MPDASAETLRIMNVAAAVNCGLAALGVAIAYYVYFYIPHSLEIRYVGRAGEVVSSAAMYICVFPVFQIFASATSALPAWLGSYRRYFIQQNLRLREQLRRPARPEQYDWDKVHRVTYFGFAAFQLLALVGTVYTSIGLLPARPSKKPPQKEAR
jgi:hypothetical protein